MTLPNVINLRRYGLGLAIILAGVLLVLSSYWPLLLQLSDRATAQVLSPVTLSLLWAGAAMMVVSGVILLCRVMPAPVASTRPVNSKKLRRQLVLLSLLSYLGLPFANLLLPLWWQSRQRGGSEAQALCRRMLDFQLSATLYAIPGLFLSVLLVGLLWLPLLALGHIIILLRELIAFRPANEALPGSLHIIHWGETTAPAHSPANNDLKPPTPIN